MRDTNAALESSMRRLQDIQHALDQAAIVAATDQTGKITYVNDKFCEISRYTRDELIGHDHRIINSGYHPKEFIGTLWRTIARGQVWRGEIRNRAKDGTIYWVDTTIVPFLDDRGKPWQYLSIRSDITQRKLAEAQLRDEAALTQMGRLSAVVAHEVRNPLAALRGSLQVLASRLPVDLPGREIITPMLARIDALNQTVKDILTYSKPSPPKVQRVALDRLIPEVAAAARAAVPGAQVEVGGEPVMVRADPEMVRAVLLNLLLNACHASGSEPVDVRTTVRAGWCTVEILDRGPGLPADVRQHLFEPFITTRPGGTGLGLPIANRLTSQQGGTLSIEDRPGGGTAAIVRLPGLEPPGS
jgi:PAS domain S-box-containing protein